MTDSRILELLGKKQAGELSPSELIELNRLISENPSKAALRQGLEDLWDIPLKITNDISAAEIDNRWSRLEEQWARPVIALPHKNKQWKRFAAAAIILTAIAGSALFVFHRYHTDGSLSTHQNVIATRNGSHSKVTLPDGTEVWLNAGSNLVYDEPFGRSMRELRLTGEAYFDVAKDPEHPFIIHTRAMDIKVLGTEFNVRAYPDEQVTEAALVKGSIEISMPGRPSDRMLLKPKEKITIRNDQLIPEPEKAVTSTIKQDQNNNKTEPKISLSSISYEPADSIIIETSWVKNKLIFRNKSFEDLIKDMERWYNITLIVKDSSLLQRRFTGTFYHETASEALDKLKASYPFEFKLDRSSNIITIQRKDQ